MSLSLAENIIVVGADNRPLMVDKTNYSSWASQPGNETNPVMIRARTYTDLTDEEKIRESVDIKATNIFLKGLPQYIYNLVNHNEHAKEIWDRVKLLIQGSELSLQERETKLYNDFDTFTSMHGEIIHSYYMRFAQLINDMHTIAPALQQSYQVAAIPQPSSIELDSGLVVPSFNPSDDPIAKLNKLMAFGRQTQGYANNKARNTATNQGVNRKGVAVQPRVVKCYNCQEEGHFARQCAKLKRPKNSAWFKEKMLLTEALESGAYLDPEQLSFLADNGHTIIQAQASQEILTLAAFQTDDFDAFDYDCDDVPSAKAVLMANLSSYDLYVLSE
ncbi:retrotransposon protein, putative, unclassified, partial [Tanacetum coccineum]